MCSAAWGGICTHTVSLGWLSVCLLCWEALPDIFAVCLGRKQSVFKCVAVMTNRYFCYCWVSTTTTPWLQTWPLSGGWSRYGKSCVSVQIESVWLQSKQKHNMAEIQGWREERLVITAECRRRLCSWRFGAWKGGAATLIVSCFAFDFRL